MLSLVSTLATIRMTLEQIKEVGDRSSRNNKWYRPTPEWIKKWFLVAESKIHVFYQFQFVITFIFFFFGPINAIVYNVCGCNTLIGRLLFNIQLHTAGIYAVISIIVTSIIKNK